MKKKIRNSTSTMHTNEQSLKRDEERIDLIDKCENCLMQINGNDGHEKNCANYFSAPGDGGIRSNNDGK